MEVARDLKLVVIGEGDSEEVVFNRLLRVFDTDFDDNIISFAPLGHRFVNHIWKLLNTLHIPYVTLLDLDLGRDGGGWGRVKYVIQQLIEIGYDKAELLKIEGGVLSDEELKEMHKWALEKEDIKVMYGWIKRLQEYDVFFSKPLDLDFLLITQYLAFYQKIIPETGGPKIPDPQTEEAKYQTKLETAVQAALKSKEADGKMYSQANKELMIWYNYFFLGRGKPATHIEALCLMTDEDVKANIPTIFPEIFKRISEILTP